MQAADAITHRPRRSGALRRHRVDEPQSGRVLYEPRRLPHGAGRVQGFPVGSADGPCRPMSPWATPPRTSRGSTRSPAPEADAFAARSFERAVAAQATRLPCRRDRAGEDREFAREGYNARGIKLRATRTETQPATAISAIRPSSSWRKSARPSAACRPAAIPPPSSMARRRRSRPRATTPRSTARRRSAALSRALRPACRRRSWASARCRRSRRVLERAGLKLSDIDRFEINEAFGAQVMACARALDLDEDKLNVNGGAIAIGHPLGATGVRLSVTLARELKRSGVRYGIASACIGGGQGIALLIENPDSNKEELDGHQGTRRDRHRRRLGPRRRDRRRCWRKRAPRSRCSTSTWMRRMRTRQEIGGIAIEVRRGRRGTAPQPPSRKRNAQARHGAHPDQLRRHRHRRSASSAATAPMPLGDFERVIRINLIGTFNMLRLFAADCRKAEPLDEGERGVIDQHRLGRGL